MEKALLSWDAQIKDLSHWHPCFLACRSFSWLWLILKTKRNSIDCWPSAQEVVYRYAIAQTEQGAHITSIGESLSGPDVTSPKMYREYEWGYAKKLAGRLKEKNILLSYHICGNATRIVSDMTETGAAILELDYKCDLKKIKQATQGKTTILGVIDPSSVLALGTSTLVMDKVREELMYWRQVEV